MSGVKDWLAKTGYRLGWKVICRVPESWARFAFSAVTEIAWRRQGHGVQVLEGNLLRVLGPGTSGKELRAASRAAMQSYGRYWMEVFRLPTFSQERILQMEVNPEANRALDMVKGGRGVIFALPHMGNWELAGAWVVASGVKFTTVAERLKPEAVFEMFVAFREGLGMEVLPLTGGAEQLRRARAAAARRAPDGVPAVRPRPHRERGRGGLLRGEGPDGRRARGAGRADRRLTAGGVAVVHRGRLGRRRQRGDSGAARG